ncbi:MAG: ThiF family adenylyltransferase, partial [Methanoculleus sp.]
MLTDRERERYSRQIALLGEEAQERLSKARLAIVGAGGLGCPVALYLAAAGVGEIRLIDGDLVDMTNLNRQVLHTESDIGRPKVESAAAKLRAQNPGIRVAAIQAALDEGNAAGHLAGVDLVIDAVDN